MKTEIKDGQGTKSTKPSKTGALTSAKGLANNLANLGWAKEAELMMEVAKKIKERIINEL